MKNKIVKELQKKKACLEIKHANTYKCINKEELSTPNHRSQARKVWKNNESTETCLESDTEAEAGCGSAVWRWGIARTFAAIVDVLSDIHNAFVFSTNFQGGRINDLLSNTAYCAACRAGFKDKTGKIIERKRPAIIERGCDRATDRTA